MKAKKVKPKYKPIYSPLPQSGNGVHDFYCENFEKDSEFSKGSSYKTKNSAGLSQGQAGSYGTQNDSKFSNLSGFSYTKDKKLGNLSF